MLIAALAFVCGFTAVFVALGASATFLGRVLADHIALLSRVAGMLLIVLGLQYAGILRLKWLNYERRFHPRMGGAGSPYAAFIIGLAFAFGWTPCVGPVLAGVLLLASRSASVSYGIALLSAYAVGLGVPFLIAAALMGAGGSALKALRRWIRPIELITGGVMVLTGIAVFAGSLSDVSGWLMQTFPALSQVG